MNLKKIIYHNLAFKIASVILAILLWLYIYFVFGAKTTKTATIKIQVEGLQPSYEVTLSQDDIQVTFSAPIQQIEQIEKNIRASLDLSSIGPGKYSKKPKLILPKDTTILLQSPSEIEVNVESIITKEFNIKPSLKGKIQPGISLGEVTLNPGKISLKGTATILQNITVVVDIDITNATSDLDGYAEIKIMNTKNEEITSIPVPSKAVRFHVPILSTEIVKTVPIIPNFIGSSPSAILSFLLNPAMVTIKGNAKELESIHSINTLPIDLSLVKSDAIVDIGLIFPTGVKKTKPEEKVTATIKTEEIITKVIPNLKIQVRNNLFHTIILSSDLCQITVIGRKSLIEKLSIPTIFIDLKNTTKGSHEFLLENTQIPEGIILQINPKKIEVKILD